MHLFASSRSFRWSQFRSSRCHQVVPPLAVLSSKSAQGLGSVVSDFGWKLSWKCEVLRGKKEEKMKQNPSQAAKTNDNTSDCRSMSCGSLDAGSSVTLCVPCSCSLQHSLLETDSCSARPFDLTWSGHLHVISACHSLQPSV